MFLYICFQFLGINDSVFHLLRLNKYTGPPAVNKDTDFTALCIVVKTIDTGARVPGFEAWLCHFLTVKA